LKALYSWQFSQPLLSKPKKECKAGYNLAYGKKVVDNLYLLSLKGSETILSRNKKSM
jgi:hypothetical protein